MAPARKKFTTGLPRDLKEELNLDDSKRPSGVKDSLRRVTGRKEKRKAERQQKKLKRSHHGNGFGRQIQGQGHYEEDSEEDQRPAPSKQQKRIEPKSPPKKAKTLKPPPSDSDSDSPAPPPKSILKRPKPKPKKASPEPSTSHISKSALAKLADDEREIKYYQKKLKMKSGKLPASFHEDGLDFLLEGLDELVQPGKLSREALEVKKEIEKKGKRKRVEVESESSGSEEGSGEEEAYSGESEEDDLDTMFLGGDDSDEEMGEASEDDDEDEEGSGEEDSEDGDDFDEDFDEDGSDEEEEEPAPKTPRENPYKPGIPSAFETASTPSTGKYIPPSLRRAASTDDEATIQLKRLIQGQINRLTESNLLAIVAEMEKLYRAHPRAIVTSAITSILLSMTCDKSTLLDTFMIIHAGFIAALYKLIGTDFGASITQKIVETFLSCYEKANKDSPEQEGKECTNLMSLLSEMYNFGVVGSVLVFDFVRMFLEDLRELNTELLLKVVRNSGYQLRQDDPTALKDLVTMLQPAIAKVGGQDKLSVRTKFMIETITNLKNNRLKSATANSAVISESTIRMKKLLGTLNNRPLRATEPLRVSLGDIKNSTKEGKWWLVGASWHNPAKLADTASDKPAQTEQEKKQAEKEKKSKSKKLTDDDDDLGGTTDLVALARAQGMNTDVRRAIFVTLMSSSDFKDAHERLLKLRLKKSQELEIPRVVIHCAANEQMHNPYYMLLAKKLCGQHNLKMAFQFGLWEQFKRMGENDGEEVDDEEMPMRKLVNLGKMYGGLVADDALNLGILKTLELMTLQRKTRIFLEVFFDTIFLRVEGDEGRIHTLIERVMDNPVAIQGLLYFMKHTMVKTDIAGGKAENALCKLSAKTMAKRLKVLLAMETVGEN